MRILGNPNQAAPEFHPEGDPLMRTLKFSALAVLTAMFFTACGDDVTKVTQEASGLEVVASADSLGKCTEERSGEMKFASKENAVYVCADSAWQNVSTAKKTSCSAESLKDSSGFKIVCDGDSVGVVLNGKDGSDGKNGEAGAVGSYCTVEESPLLDSDFGRGAYLVVCGSDTVGTIRDGFMGEGCVITDNSDGSVTLVCGADSVNLYKALCGGKPFDPDLSFCYEDSVATRCGGKSYDLSESFCLGDSIVALCGGKRFAPETEFCYADSIVPLCNGKSYSLDSSFCYGDSVIALCGGKIYDLQDSVCHEERLFGFFEDSRDGQVYRSVKIGEQIWMAENLNYAYMPDTLSFCYNDSAEYCEKYGRLYTWAAAMDSIARFTKNGEGCGYDTTTCSLTYPVRGVCPAGWHLPSRAEWDAMKVFVADSLFGGETDSVGYALKSISGWDNNGNGSDAFGFGALPTGFGQNININVNINRRYFYDIFLYAHFWNSTEGNGELAVGIRMIYSSSRLFFADLFKMLANSIRCVKDN